MDLVVVGIALAISIGLAVSLLARQRARARPEDADVPNQPRPIRRTRQQKILEKLEPLPEIPTVMDLVREEVAETGVENIPGHEGLTGPVMLKVFRRDQLARERCTHDGIEFLVAEGIDPPNALERDVSLFCKQCGPTVTAGTDDTEADSDA